jgi:hypothetical protein
MWPALTRRGFVVLQPNSRSQEWILDISDDHPRLAIAAYLD